MHWLASTNEYSSETVLSSILLEVEHLVLLLLLIGTQMRSSLFLDNPRKTNNVISEMNLSVHHQGWFGVVSALESMAYENYHIYTASPWS